MSDKDELLATIKELAELKEELRDMEDMLRKEHPGLMARRDEIMQEVPTVQRKLKTLARDVGPGNHSYGTHVVQVRNPPVKKTVDLEGILDRAEERGEVHALLDAEVLGYKVNVHMLERLEGQMKAVYMSYVEESEGTASVVLPSQLK